ncbi:hypothetical protein G6L37_00860 [Agrobacterium rubi]|nr:hypothetical protein [Agrobacterium rubi]NTF23941.1 hypothetical protein [Agrobacterium rubi]
MTVTVIYDTFRFSNAKYIKPDDVSLRGHSVANTFISKANQIVRELARAGWDVPGFDVEIRYYGSGTNVFKHCSSVSFDVAMPDGSTEKAQISYFNRAGSQVGRWSQLGSASSFKLGEFKVQLHSDGSGDWKKLDSLQAAIDSLDPALSTVMQLPSKPGHDIAHPEGDLNLREICTTVPTPAPADFPTLYAWVERSKANNALGLGPRYSEGEWARDEEYILTGNGWRFVTSDHVAWAEIPPGAWNGYDYASTDITERPAGLNMPNSSGILPVEIRLKHLDDIYVADLAPYEQARAAAEAEADAEGRKDWRPGEYGNFVRASMVTFVPASEYKGGYVKPVYMIGRQLQQDEAFGLAGKVSVEMDDGFVVAKMHDKRKGDVVLYEGSDELYHKKRAVGDAWEIARILGDEPDIAPEISEAIEAHHAKLREEYKGDKTMSLLLGSST